VHALGKPSTAVEVALGNHPAGVQQEYQFAVAILVLQLYWCQPVALIYPITGSVIIPSGRTGTTLDISGSFHTLMLRMSSTPMTKLSGCRSATRGSVVSGAAGCPDLAGYMESGNTGLATLAEFVEFCPDAAPNRQANRISSVSPRIARFPRVPFLRMPLPTFVENYSALSSTSRLPAELERRWGIPTSLSLYSNAR